MHNQLKQGSKLFTFNPEAQCQLNKTNIDSDLFEPITKEHHNEESHNDAEVEWRFICTHPDRLLQVRVNLFKHFSYLQELDTQYLSAERQGAVELTNDNSILIF